MKMRSKNDLMVRKVITTMMVIGMSMMLTACGGKTKATNSNGEPVVDMTRPPVMINDIQEQVVESNPDEVISYEKWKQQREEDEAQNAKEGQEATEPKEAETIQDSENEPK